eukprot:PhM_4_TR3307/c0_g1_i1/m.49931
MQFNAIRAAIEALSVERPETSDNNNNDNEQGNQNSTSKRAAKIITAPAPGEAPGGGDGSNNLASTVSGGPSTHVESAIEWRGEWMSKPTEAGDSSAPTAVIASPASSARPCKLVGGSQMPLTEEELAELRGTPFERGYQLYRYEGQMKKLRSDARMDVKDARYWARDGQGMMKYASGDMYDGGWRMNKRHGSGTLRLATGYMYQGDWREDRIQGNGRETFGRKWELIANFDNGLPVGKGTIWYGPTDHRKYRYEGEFKGGLRHGKGVVYYDNGDVFEGTWENGRREGAGKITYPNGRQYESKWHNDQLVGTLHCIDRKLRKPPPTSTTKYEKLVCLAPADLTKWKVQDDCWELPLEHFHRLRLGFDLLDVAATGELSMTDLKKVWPMNDREMLLKLDKDKSGTVDFMEVLMGWYPNVPEQELMRFLYRFLSPSTLFQLRGILAGVHHKNNHYYSTVACGGPTMDWRAPANAICPECGMEADQHRGDVPPDRKRPMNSGFYGVAGFYHEPEGGVVGLTHQQLEKATPPYVIGGEKFTSSMHTQASASHDPPTFVDVLEVLYPNISYTMLQCYDASSLPSVTEMQTLRNHFSAIASRGGALVISQFEESVDKYRQTMENKTSNIRVSNEFVYSLHKPGLFRAWVMWQVGPIEVCVAMLEEAAAFAALDDEQPREHNDNGDNEHDNSDKTVEFRDFLRFSFPNIPCRWTRRRLGEAMSKEHAMQCKCEICTCELP